ncbi:hypothetical protein TPADAL_0591a [Treponema pallidum subsp. pallidum DAL-1]|uniref:Uncharacterized protein n=2 Tax=Treponema pallidum TaxID=160 RepID=A0AAU8RXI1_TREPL|nr:hypothetical protein TPESAMD_0591a [Treponema pallidum subsp. pertenue str. SamoaD]AEZ58785.1 hypothetical protein TPECDC2_0591a [Treponema pallidum subsp. pertenue str. CDC2]AEZ59853.1 hypothetical protein TPEGAU_0591a [Treponema pallidum subsp. pertenue str. Gauthier]AEZ60914.1 hypothetical protein TPADAL_0591a [Treponema pallidum subsp. pallidum DAL-1]AGK84237.1 hypothetical protein TPFB_0591a [Treponema pallidum str. Fribourg-Blanc]AJB40613.1 hypothetical protein TENDBA_0591a [Treponema
MVTCDTTQIKRIALFQIELEHIENGKKRSTHGRYCSTKARTRKRAHRSESLSSREPQVRTGTLDFYIQLVSADGARVWGTRSISSAERAAAS